MMLDFLKHWQRSEQRLFYSSFIALFAIFCYFLWKWYLGLDNVLTWDILGQLEQVPVIADEFSDGQYRFQINGLAYFVKEQFLAPQMKVKNLDFYIFGGLYLLGLVLVLTSISAASVWVFRVSILALAGIILLSHLEVLGGNPQVYFLASFLVLGGTAYYFHDFRAGISATFRFLIYLGLFALALFLVRFSTTPQPLLALIAYSQAGAILLTIFFVFLLSHENIAGITRLIGASSPKGKNTLFPVFVMGGIYLLNLLIIFLHNTKTIAWDGWLLSPFVFFVVSLAFGFRGFQDWCDTDDDVLPFRSAGLWAYLGLGIISTASIAFAFATGNDPLVEAYEDAIVYSYLFMGLGFLVYLLINFLPLFKQGLAVHRVMYKPLHFELYGIRLVSLIAIAALLSTENYFPFYQTIAGTQNTIGDYYNLNNEKSIAEAFYKNAINYEFQNHKSNYALASLALEQGNRVAAGVFFKSALLKNPSEYAYAGLSRKLLEEDAYFEAIFALREGLKQFPKSGELQTNLAFLYEKSKMTDSVRHYLALAKENCRNKEIGEENYLNLSKNELTPKEKSVLSPNQLAVLKVQRNELEDSFDLELRPDSALGVREFAYIYNHFTRKGAKTDNKIIEKLLPKQGNESYAEDLLFAQAFSNYYKGNKIAGLKGISQLSADSSQNVQLYKRTAGIWFLQEGLVDLGFDYLKQSGDESLKLLNTPQYHQHLQEQIRNQADIVLKAKAQNAEGWRKIVGFAPFNPFVLQEAVTFFNKNKQNKEAYQILFDALEMKSPSPEIRKMYVLQCLDMGLTDYAKDALSQLSPADYQAFLPTYQAKIALIEKSKASFR